MSIIHRFARNSAARNVAVAVAGPQNRAEARASGTAGRIVCSPWEGLYLEQGRAYPKESCAPERDELPVPGIESRRLIRMRAGHEHRR